jgi:ketosteroid isomerase-like protein
MEQIPFEFAKKFANEWIRGWNSHNLETILKHYSEDFTIESPMAEKLMPESKGKIKGKNNIREYWKMGLERNKDLEFEMIDIFSGTGYITIYYLSKSIGKRVLEILHFNQQKFVDRVIVNYSE